MAGSFDRIYHFPGGESRIPGLSATEENTFCLSGNKGTFTGKTKGEQPVSEAGKVADSKWSDIPCREQDDNLEIYELAIFAGNAGDCGSVTGFPRDGGLLRGIIVLFAGVAVGVSERQG